MEMLVQFNFENFKSFRDENTLDMTATSIKEHPYNVIEYTSKDRFLKVATIYGANASGKSNVIEAFNFMRYFVLNSLAINEDINKKDEIIPVKSFAFDDNKNETSLFEVFFIVDNVEYQYGFTVDNKRIYEEWLYSRNIRRKNTTTLFQREGNDIVCGAKMKDAEKFIESVDDKTLFVTLTAKTNVKVSKIVFKWFLDSFVIDFGDSIFEAYISNYLSNEIITDEVYKKKVEEFLIAIDTGIKGIRVEEIKDDKKKKYRIFAKHATKTGEMVEIPFEEESSGTIKMFCLFNFFLKSLENGTPLFIDELNAKLHPLLVRYIVNMFHDPEINKKNAQLIFTTHDVSTLTKDVFRRDEIWFTEKDEEGVSTLFSLVEYRLDDNSKVRNDATYNKDYLSGRYGAIPILREFNILED